MYITEEKLNDLILKWELSNIDFKRKWHESNVSLVHDILCLSNAVILTETTRYLIFGVTNNKEICGVLNDQNRKNNAKLHDLINKISFNIRPDLQVCTVQIGNTEIDYIVISDKPEKPYYLLKDYLPKNSNDRVRAGVIYSRTSDRNTPIADEGIHDLHLQKMFEERLGINKPINERFGIYLSDFENWVYFDDENYGYYYNKFPEFTLTQRLSSRRFVERRESWMPPCINSKATITTYLLKYHTTLIMVVEIFDSGDSNYQFCLPEIDFPESGVCNDSGNIYFFKKNTVKYNISCLLYHQQMRKDYDFRNLKIEIRE